MAEKPTLSYADMQATSERLVRELSDGEEDLQTGDAVRAKVVQDWSERAGLEEGVYQRGSQTAVLQALSMLMSGAPPQQVLEGLYAGSFVAGWYGRELLHGKEEINER